VLGVGPVDEFDDSLPDPDVVEAGAWVPGPYGPGDERGSFGEVTPAKTARALAILDSSRPVHTYDLSEQLFEEFPAWGGRSFRQRLHCFGYTPPADFEGTSTSDQPVGTNRLSVNEERVELTYNMGTKINGLAHCGVGTMYYNGYRATDVAGPRGLRHLGNHLAGPIVTRGVLLDIVGMKCAAGETDDYFVLNGTKPVLRSNYRITVEDLRAAEEFAQLSSPIEAGDVILIRTGWRELIHTHPRRYIEDLPPGPYLREARYLAGFRPALIGIDVWVFGVIDPEIERGAHAACHQELFVRHGIRIGEAIRSDLLAADNVYEFVFCAHPTNVVGAVAGNSPPFALGQPGKDRGS
jgi:kynurenine formamidase